MVRTETRAAPKKGHRWQELTRRGWDPEELKARRKCDKHKVAIAVRLRRETTMTLKWIAERLEMGSWNDVSNRLAALPKPS